MKTYRIRVSLLSDPSVWREALVSSAHTLGQLHDLLRDALELEEDRPYSFFRSGRPWDQQGWYGGPGSGAPKEAAGAPLGRLRLKPGTTFLYLQDFHREHWFLVRVLRAREADHPRPHPRVAQGEGRMPAREEAAGGAPPPAGPPPRGEVRAMWDMARRLLQSRVKVSLESDPDSASGHDLEEDWRLALEVRAWHGGRAGRLAALGVQAGADAVGWLADLAHLLFERGERDRALRLARAFSRSAPFPLAAIHAVLLAESGAREEALAEVERILADYPEHPGMLMLAGDALLHCGQAERGLESWVRAADIAGEDSEIGATVRERLESLAQAPGPRAVVPGEARRKAGRNEPCPCGSGRKFKKCCGAERPGARGARGGERAAARGPEAEALGRLVDLGLGRARAPAHREDVEEAVVTYWGEEVAGLAFDEVAPLAGPPGVAATFVEWLLFDHRMSGGSTLLEALLEDRHARLSAVERTVARRCIDSHLGLYQILEVRPGHGLLLADLLEGGRLEVRERAGSHQMRRWDLLAARILELDGDPALAAGLILFGPEHKEWLLEAVHDCARDIRRRWRGASWPVVLQATGFVFNDMLEALADRPPPRLATTDGEPLVLCKARYRLADPAAATPLLRAVQGFEEVSPGSLDWTEPRGGDSVLRLGGVTIEGEGLALECTSRERLARGRALIEEALGDRAEHLEDDFEDPHRALGRLPPPDGPAGEGLPPEIEAEIVGKFLEEHYRRWPDTPLPALGGQTPRQAARSGEGRARLADLLREMENREDRPERPAPLRYDFSRLWKELGLDPGEGL